MILIKNIEVAVVEGDHQSIVYRFQKERVDSLKNITLTKDVVLTEEMVYGRRYSTADGREIVIGMTKDVQKAIGLPYEAFEVEVKRREDAWLMANGIQKLFDEYKDHIKNMPFLGRFRALFMGFR